MTKELNDSLDDLLSSPAGDVRSTPVHAPADYQPRAYDETCAKCRGTGQTRWGVCFACKGAGKRSFKSSPETRTASRQAYAERKDRVATDTLAAFEAVNPAVWAWIKANSANFDFAAKMGEAIVHYGSLTDGQMAACVRCMDRAAAYTAQRTERAQQAPAADSAGIDRLKTAFDHAIAYASAKGRGLKAPRITIGDVVISPAPASGKNPGAIYVKSGGEYLGKVVDGHFHASRACTPDLTAKVIAFIKDPKAAAEVYGIETGTCCICNATLTNKESIERGIGPICAEKFGW